MADARFGGGRTDDDGRMPWLEPVKEEEESSEPSFGKMIGLVILGLVLLGVAVGGYSWWSQSGATGGDGELIAAPAGPYKIKPTDPGGMDVEGEGDTSFAASEGADPKGRIDMSAIPEAPVVKAEPQAASEAPSEAQPEPKQTDAAPAGEAASTIQLGAFSSEAAANNAWKGLSGRFSYLEPLSHSIIPVRSGDRTLYRLRAGGPGAGNICGRLRVAGESCVSVN